MKFGLFEFLQLIGALGFFIYGMKVMSESIQKVAGKKMNQILGAMTSNRFTGVFTGFFTTSLIQSSSATTVMIVSFVNAGILTLRQAIGVIMGANIGTTMTAVLITVFGFSKFKIVSFALPIIGIGFPMLFARKSSIKAWGEFLIGFALLFIGLDELKNSIPELNAEALEGLTNLQGYGVLSTLLFVLIGTIITIIVQSSSAAMALTLVLCQKGLIPFEIAAAIVLGENIGTTITANLAALIANIHAKRAAFAHLIFNVFGVIWMMFVFNFFLDGIDQYMRTTPSGSPKENVDAVKWGLTIFHISFNILNTLVLVWFVPVIEKVVIRLIKSKSSIEEEYHLDYIGTGIMATPEISIIEAKKEIAKFGRVTKKMSTAVQDLLLEKEKKQKVKHLDKIKKLEEVTDKLEKEIANYLARVAEQNLSESASVDIRGMLSIITDLERIGDIYFQMSKTIEAKNEAKLWFTPEQRSNLKEFYTLVDQALDVMISNLEKDYSTVSKQKAVDLEMEINKMRNKLKREQLKSIDKGSYNIHCGMIYNELFSSCEKVGDHIINVSEAITGEV